MKTIALSLVIGALSLPALGGLQKAKKSAPDWRIAGWEVTTCCCNDICPCRFNEKPTHMECEGIMAIHIDKGHYGSTNLSDVNFIVTGRSFDDAGKGWNRIYFDKKASTAEQKAVGGIMASMASSYKPDVAKKVFGEESRGVKVIPMTFTKSPNGLVREIKAPGVCDVRARIGKVPTSKKPTQITGVLTEFSPVYHPAAGIKATADKDVGFDHPEHHRAEVEDFVLTRDAYLSRKIGFQSYTGRGGCLMPSKTK